MVGVGEHRRVARRVAVRPQRRRRRGRRASTPAAWRRPTLAAPRQFPPSSRPVQSHVVDLELGGDHRRATEVRGERPQVDAVRRRHEDDVVAVGLMAMQLVDDVGPQPVLVDVRRERRPQRLDLGDGRPVNAASAATALTASRSRRARAGTRRPDRAARAPADRRFPGRVAGTARRSRGSSACRRRRTRRRPSASRS